MTFVHDRGDHHCVLRPSTKQKVRRRGPADLIANPIALGGGSDRGQLLNLGGGGGLKSRN